MEFTYSVSLTCVDQTVIEPALQYTGDGIYQGKAENITLYLKTGAEIAVSICNDSPRAIASVAWRLLCDCEEGCRVPLSCDSVRYSGVIKLEEQSPKSSMMTGLFYGADKPCLFLGTRLPQNNIHMYQVRREPGSRVSITGTTQFTEGQSGLQRLSSEVTLIFEGDTPLAAVEKWAEHLPDAAVPEPMIGWNSWDYYFTTVSSQAVRENLEFIRNDPVLKEKIKTVVVDDGWETCVGEWYANHRFPEGLSYLAQMIKDSAMLPGIWTNGPQTETLSEPALRHPEYYVLDEYGIPFTVDGKQVLDPTHPAAQGFILDTYSRLYEAGFRVFKVDFLSTLLQAKRFYDPACGPYEAIRRLLRLVRSAVGTDSHIVGCSYPPECGANIVDSSRISCDIHNHWPHVIWIMEYMQARFWCNGKLFRSDPDMLVVRGRETSLEEETNVFNPWNLVPPGEDRFSSRWRRGPVFNYLEAETWANLVVFSGGDIMLGDRLSMLNSKGLEILYNHLKPHEHAAVPLDLGDGEVAQFWYDRFTASMLAVNTADTLSNMTFDFARYGLPAPDSVSCDKPFLLERGVLQLTLQPHESAVIALAAQ